jgi:hypothetical protein
MDDQLRRQLLAEAVRLGDELLDNAIYHDEGLSWQCIYSSDGTPILVENETIYNGTCGIVIFLLELYQQTDDESYMTAAKQGMRWVEAYCTANPASTYALLTGRLSVSFTFLRMYHITADQQYLDKALSNARLVSSSLDYNITDLLNGISGILLGLLHLYAASKAAWILPQIDAFIGQLLKKAFHGKQGLYWDRSSSNIHGLCGFSHGASGLGFVFLEIGHFFKNEAFYWVAEQTFLYESQYYSPTCNNWIDWRRGIYKEEIEREFRQAYQNANLPFFTTGNYMNAWCHGAAGIGLARLRAYELQPKNEYLHEVEMALKATKGTDVNSPLISSYTLCHGSGGNAELFLEAFRILKDEQYLDLAGTIAQKALLSHQMSHLYLCGSNCPGEDTSLFLGNAGIGYFYLRLLQPLKVPSVLAPILDTVAKDVDQSIYPDIFLSLPDIQRRVLLMLFPRTICLLEYLIPDKVAAHFDEGTPKEQIHLKENWIAFVQREASLLSADNMAVMEDVFGLELTKLQLDESVTSDALLYLKSMVKMEGAQRLESLDERSFFGARLVTDSDLTLVETKWDWSSNASENWLHNLQKAPNEYILLLIPTALGIQEHLVTSFFSVVLAAFQETALVQEAVCSVLIQLESLTAEQAAEISQLIVEQIHQAIRAHLLLDPAEHPLNGVDHVNKVKCLTTEKV